jgi:DNA-binding transcriptional LysR family regulator
MDRLSAMRVFVAVVETQGFSAASRLLCKPLPTVCRKIAELESELDAQLFVRSTRKVTVTDTGSRYYENVRRILEDIDSAERQASGEFQRATGLLSITTPSMFGQLHILPIVNEFMRLHEEIEVRLLYTKNHLLDLPEDQIDLALRIGTLSASTMNIMPVGTVRQIVCASPSYIEANGCPASPAEAALHQCVTFSRSGSQYPWTFKMPSGKIQETIVRSKLFLNSAESAIAAALHGCGLAQLFSYQADAHVARGDLQIVLDDFEIAPPPVNLVVPNSPRVPQKVKAFIDFAMPALRQRLIEAGKMSSA